MKIPKYIKIVSVAIIMMLFLPFLLSQESYAKTLLDTDYEGGSGRENCYGYFDNIRDCSGDYVLPSIYTNSLGQNVAIPDSINSIDSFIDFLKDSYNNPTDDRAEVGAAFILESMLGFDVPGRSKTPNPATWELLRAALKNPKYGITIDWTSNVQGCTNSMYQGDNAGSNPNDDTYYYDSSCKSEPGIAFYNYDGSVGYVLKRRCANPLGNISIKIGPPDVVPTKSDCRPIIVPVVDPSWGSNKDDVGNPISVTARVNGTSFVYTSYPGGSIGPSQITKDLTTGDTYTMSFTTNNYVAQKAYYGWYDIYGYGHDYHAAVYRTDTWPSSNIGPCYDYEALPQSVTVSQSRVEISSMISISSSAYYQAWTKTHAANDTFDNLTNVGGFYYRYLTQTKSKQINWQINQVLIPPNSAVPAKSVASNTQQPCTYFASIGSCSLVRKGSVYLNSSGSYASGDNPYSQYQQVIGDYDAGTKVCFALSMSPPASDPTSGTSSPESTWSHSGLNGSNCSIVVKKPKVQVWGGDLFAGASPSTPSVLTTTSVKSFNGSQYVTFGSWAEYGIFATGSISGMGSGAAFAGAYGLSGTDTAVCNYSTLSFSNTLGSNNKCTGSGIGNYSSANDIPNVAADFPSTNAPTVGSGDISGLQGIYKASGDLTITGGSIKKSQWVVINSPGSTVNITGNINYTSDSLSNVNEIPQVVIIARNIYIDQNVTNIDAWLIATGNGVASEGNINTCVQAGTSNRLTVNDCNKPLTVNGPVMAKHLYLRRTYGSSVEANSGDPSEVFNFRADSFLWAYSRATSSGRVQTVYTTEVPPRL